MSKRDSGRQRATYLTGMSEWLNELDLGTGENLLRTTRDSKLWRATIVYVLNGHGLMKVRVIGEGLRDELM